ncbi:MAG: hypothetical protein M3033_18025 [Acidobacteriota bacterium]|nr:hypothetical protein [Acidobacteriota bacterium]
MSENLDNINELRKYLLGQMTDDDALNRIEERLLTDREFFAELEIVEDDLIEDYVAGRLSGAELENFKRLFLNVPERGEKIHFARALRRLVAEENQKKEKKKFAFFGNWILSPQAAYGLIGLCIAVICFSIFWFNFRQSDSEKSIAELKSIYKTARPIQARIAGFDYSPFTVLRGNDREDANKIPRRKIELDLESAGEKNPNEQNFNALGFYYLTEKRFDEAAAQFENALNLNQRNTEARVNLAATFYEQAKLENSEEKSKLLDKSLQELNKTLETNRNLPEAVFNKALVLQEMNQPKEAAEVWKQYLEQDANSKWADEARANLRALEGS